MVRLVDDESEPRAAAQRALSRPEAAGLEAAGGEEYEAPVRHRDFASFRDRVLLVDDRRRAAFAARGGEVEERFRTAGREGPRGWEFLSPTRVTLLRRPADDDGEGR
jgi:hypothetical protein